MKDKSSLGFACALTSFILWGALPLYWKKLQIVSPLEILSHRIIWAMFFLAILISFKKLWKDVFSFFKEKNKILPLVISTLLVGVNWYLYIFAVNNHRVFEASLGYYLNPLLTVVAGLIFFKETLSKRQTIAIILGFLAFMYLVLHHHTLPFISFIIAITFCLYGVAHKKMGHNALSTLFVETLLLSFPSFFYLLSLGKDNHFLFSSLEITLLLLGAGPVTAIPLLLFVYSTDKVKMTTIGILEYFSPTGQFLCGIFFFNEPFTRTWLVTFILIWLAVIVYLSAHLKKKCATLKS